MAVAARRFSRCERVCAAVSPEQRQRTRCVATAAELGPYTHLPHIVSDAGVVAEHAYRTVLQRAATSCTVLQRWHVVLLIMEFRSRHVLAHPSVPAWADADLPRRPVHARCAAVLSSTLLRPVHARCAASFAPSSGPLPLWPPHLAQPMQPCLPQCDDPPPS